MIAVLIPQQQQVENIDFFKVGKLYKSLYSMQLLHNSDYTKTFGYITRDVVIQITKTSKGSMSQNTFIENGHNGVEYIKIECLCPSIYCSTFSGGTYEWYHTTKPQIGYIFYPNISFAPTSPLEFRFAEIKI